MFNFNYLLILMSRMDY